MIGWFSCSVPHKRLRQGYPKGVWMLCILFYLCEILRQVWRSGGQEGAGRMGVDTVRQLIHSNGTKDHASVLCQPGSRARLRTLHTRLCDPASVGPRPNTITQTWERRSGRGPVDGRKEVDAKGCNQNVVFWFHPRDRITQLET